MSRALLCLLASVAVVACELRERPAEIAFSTNCERDPATGISTVAAQVRDVSGEGIGAARVRWAVEPPDSARMVEHDDQSVRRDWAGVVVDGVVRASLESVDGGAFDVRLQTTEDVFTEARATVSTSDAGVCVLTPRSAP